MHGTTTTKTHNYHHTAISDLKLVSHPHKCVPRYASVNLRLGHEGGIELHLWIGLTPGCEFEVPIMGCRSSIWPTVGG